MPSGVAWFQRRRWTTRPTPGRIVFFHFPGGSVKRVSQVDHSQERFNALVSFAFNVGTEAFRRSTLLERLDAGRYEAVPKQLRRRVTAGGRRLPGLVARREAEARLFAAGRYA